jgi:hypothetical protein
MGFKVTVNMENDAELRAYIKDLIKGQVLSVTREEILNIVKEETERKMKGMNSYNFEFMIKQAFKEAAAEHFRKEKQNVKEYGEDYAKRLITESVDTAMKGKDWNKLVDDAAQKFLKSLIK